MGDLIVSVPDNCLSVSFFKEIVLKLATNGHSDKAFLLTSKLYLQGVVCPFPEAIYINKINENVYKIRLKKNLILNLQQMGKVIRPFC